MKEVPSPDADRIWPENDGSTHPIRPVSAVGLELESSLPALRLLLHASESARPFAFLLTPPAAKQLAMLLEEAVNQYLTGEPPPETE